MNKFENAKIYEFRGKNGLQSYTFVFGSSMTLSLLKRRKSPKFNFIKEYGWENFEKNILEECSREQLRERELEWVNKLNPSLNRKIFTLHYFVLWHFQVFEHSVFYVDCQKFVGPLISEKLSVFKKLSVQKNI